MSSGWRFARSCALMLPQCDEVTAANSADKPIVTITATPSDQRVERNVISFVHSERMTCHWVTRPVVARRGIVED